MLVPVKGTLCKTCDETLGLGVYPELSSASKHIIFEVKDTEYNLHAET